MDRAVVQNHQYRQIRTAFAAYVLQEGAHVLGLGGWGECYDRPPPVYGAESECVRPQLIRVLLAPRPIGGPEADGIGYGLRGGFVPESENERAALQTIQSIAEVFFKRASASSGRL